MRFTALTEKLEGTLGKLNNLSFAVFFALIIRFNLFIGNRLDHLYNLFRFANKIDEFLVFGLQ